MSEISAEQVKELREVTGAGIMDVKSALSETGGNLEEAMEILTRKGIIKSAERSDREATDGLVLVSLAEDKKSCSLVYLSAETDFSAKAEDFIELGNKISQAVLEGSQSVKDDFKEDLDNIRLTKKENIELKKAELIKAGDGNILDAYLHNQDGRGINAVIVEGSGVDEEALHQVSLHIAFAKPVFLSKDEIPAEEIDAQLELGRERAIQEGKPDDALEKIAQGRLTGWLKERVLLEQGLHGDKVKVADTLKGGSIVRFIQAYIR